MHTSMCLYKHVSCYLLDTGSLMLNTVFELQMLLDLCHVISSHKMWPALTLSVQCIRFPKQVERISKRRGHVACISIRQAEKMLYPCRMLAPFFSRPRFFPPIKMFSSLLT